MKNQLISLSVAAFVAAGCASGPATMPLVASPAVVAAEGSIKTSRTDNGNTAIQIAVKHLADPQKVVPGASTYVVWAQAPGATNAMNLGALRVDDELNGSLATVTPLQAFELFVTPEMSPTAAAPTSDRVLSANVAHGVN